jgi:hypothetical protein
MKKIAALTLSIFLSGGAALADTPKDADASSTATAGAAAAKTAAAAKAAKAKAAKSAGSSEARFAAELEELRQTLQAQQEQLQLLKEELAKRDRQIDEARDAATAANARAVEASVKAAEASSRVVVANSRAAETASTTAEVKSAASSVNSTASDVKMSNDTMNRETVSKESGRTTSTAAAAQEKEETGPSAIRYKGVTITPGGFIEAATVTRTRANSADINSSFTNIPYPGNSLSKVAETNFTARQSRATVLFESKIGTAKLTGYYEGDFLNAGVTSNNRQSNSYPFRQRQVWGQVTFDSGWSFTGGQMWTLATENRKGINNRQEWLPMMVDPQYVVGFTWARQYGFRVVKDFGGKFALALSVEGPQATLGGRGFSNVTATNAVGVQTISQNFFINAPGQAGGLLNAFDATGYTVNKAPDIIIKAAADPGFGHYELFGIISTFRNRIFPCAVVGTNAKDNPPPTPAAAFSLPCSVDGTTAPSAAGAFNDTRVGGGLGASLDVPLFGKKLDFAIKGVAGDGIGRYGSAQLADETFRPDGTAALIRTAHGLGRLEFHPNSKLDIYLYGGSEYAFRAGYQGYTLITVAATPGITTVTPTIPAGTKTTITTTAIGGYGNPAANNSLCSQEKAPTGSFTPSTGGTCAGDIRIITEGTLGFWHKFYSGPKGGMRWGIAYSYITKSGWSGNAGPGCALGCSPKAVDNMIWTSFRYYIP